MADAGGTNQAAEPVAEYQTRFTGFRDTAFSENHQRALHRWVPWIAGFSASFVDEVLKEVRQETSGPLTVLEPFAGVGTTLVEAMKKGHDAIGFEINPYAALALRLKTEAASYDVSALRERIDAFEGYMGGVCHDGDATPESRPPEGFVSRVPFFSSRVERQVLLALDFIRGETAAWIRDLFRLALGSVMVGFSNYSYEPSLGTRAAAGKRNIENADVQAVLVGKLEEMADDICFFQGVLDRFHPKPRARVYADSFFDAAGQVELHSVDVLITSPPYLNNYHYIRNTRPQMFWLDMVEKPADLKPMEKKSFGQFWQTVRSGPPVALEPDLPELAALLGELRHRNSERGVYGGAGWANYAATYFNDCLRFCRIARDQLRPRGKAVIIIGNNILQGIEFPTDRFFADIARQCGFEIVELHEVRTKRTGNSIINSSVRKGVVKKRVKLYETAIEMRAPASESA